uniref:Uncharacterized protein n=1 Tax=Vespula pensylvanica TaxID=30213 RepID=A0A834NRZ9_VESPE|nr:hypothetical protein H0235_011478 [Vespula pensylvanica]
METVSRVVGKDKKEDKEGRDRKSRGMKNNKDKMTVAIKLRTRPRRYLGFDGPSYDGRPISLMTRKGRKVKL